MDVWYRFLDLMFTNEYYRAGFFSALIVVAFVWIVSGLFYRLHVQWLKMRQFFEPIKKPAKAPTETGPSPASILAGCMVRIVVTALVLAVAIVGLLWLMNSPG